jgi:hypothetical protein
MTDVLRNNKDWLTVIFVSIAVFVIAVIGGDRFFSKIHPDFVNGYYPGALSLQQGLGYLDAKGKSITHWPPGYSVFIMGFVNEDLNDSISRLRSVSGFLAIFNTVLLAIISFKIVPRIQMWIILPFLVLWPPVLPMLSPLGSELLFTVILNLSILLLIASPESSGRRFPLFIIILAVGILMGFLGLTRTIGLSVFISALIAILIGWRMWNLNRRIFAGFLLLLIYSMVITPWTVSVHNHTGQYSFSTAGENSMWDGLDNFPQYRAGRELISLKKSGSSPGQAVLQVAGSYPAEFIGLLTDKLFRPWHATHSGNLDNYLRLFNIPVLVLFLAALLRSICIWNRLPHAIILLLGTVIACWLSAFMVLSIFRYMAPVFPLVFVVIAWHIEDFRCQSRNIFSCSQSQ